MRLSKKGFVFIETLVTIVILTMALLSLYVLFNNMLIKEKRRLYYDDPIYIYRAITITNAFQDVFNNTTVHEQDFEAPYGFEDLLTVYDSNGTPNHVYLRELTCSNDVFDYGDNTQLDCSNFLSYYNVYKIYVSKYDLSYTNTCRNNPNSSDCVVYKNLSAQAKNYINALNYTPNTEGYYIIYEFADNGDGTSCGVSCQHAFASIKYAMSE